MKFSFITTGHQMRVYAERLGRPRRFLGTLTMEPEDRLAFEMIVALAGREQPTAQGVRAPGGGEALPIQGQSEGTP